MITNIYCPSSSLQILNVGNSQPYGKNSEVVGSVRYNMEYHQLETYDGFQWINLSSKYSIDLSNEVIEILSWAKQEMDKKSKYEKLSSKYPAIADALERVKDSEALLEEVYILCSEQNS